MNSVSLDHPRSRSTFRTVKMLVGSYLGISVLTLVAIILMRHDTAAVNAAVWIRGTIVVVSALLMTSFAVRAARGSGRAYLRLRLVSAIMVAAIAVIVALPGTFPLWMKIEQSVCGLVLLAVVFLVNSKHMRSVFTANG
jgi:hypothetical protein